MRKPFLFLGLFLLATLGVILAGCGSGGNPGTNTGVGTLRGSVYDAANADLEVENATVTTTGLSTTTFSRDTANAASPVGSYVIPNVPVGTDTVEVQIPGADKQKFAFTPPILKNGVSVVNLYINIGQLRGTVVRPDGKPAAGAFVTYISDLRSEALQTDADGKFLFPTVPKGQVRVESQFGPASDTRTVTMGNGLLDLGQIRLVESSSGTPGLPYSIKGTVKSASGDKLSGLSVALIRNNVQQETAVTATDGTYQFAVPAGAYTLRITSANFQDAEKVITLVSTNQPITADFSLTPR
jgi:hypothetical protein